MNKIRTIITQDAEIDDQNSLRHILLYANDIEIQGIIQTSSKFHWKGKKDAMGSYQETPFNQAYRWTGTSWMWEVIDDYESVYPNLVQHDKAYPSPASLREIIQIGNIGYVGEMEQASDGSNLIKERILDKDPRKLYIQVWGGTNTIARALYDIEQEYKECESWNELKAKIEEKVVLTACGQQDETYETYISQVFPNIQFIECLQMGSYAYAWNTMPEGASKESLRAKFMKENIVNKGKLLEKYGTWADGQVYEGEEDGSQFGSNPELLKDWWGSQWGLGLYHPFDFLSEGDSPTFLCLLPWGLRNLEDFTNLSLSGRYRKDATKKNKKGHPLNYWIPEKDDYLCPDESVVNTESMWRFVEDIQNDFASRANWCISLENEEAPLVQLNMENTYYSHPGEKVIISIQQQKDVEYTCELYKPLSTISVKFLSAFEIQIPKEAKTNDVIHILIKGKNKYKHKLVRYNYLIIKII